MTKRKKGLIVLFSIIIVFGVFLYVISQKDEKETGEEIENIPFAEELPTETNEATIDTIEEAPNPVATPKKAHVYVVDGGWLSLDDTEKIEAEMGSWPSKLSEDTRFILLPSDKKVSNAEQKQLKDWIAEGKTVFFYGKDVKAGKTLEILGVDKEPIEVQSNAELRYILYGYGYSEGYDANLPLFTSSNTSDLSSLTGFISEFLYEYRGF